MSNQPKDNTHQLPAEVLADISAKSEAAYLQLDSIVSDVGDCFGLPMFEKRLGPIEEAITEYATLLHQEKLAHEATRQRFRDQLNERLASAKEEMNEVEKENAALQAKCERYEKALKDIAENEGTCCMRCEGNGKLWADGQAHLPSYDGPTVNCGNCGGSGRIHDDLQEIANEALSGEGEKEGARDKIALICHALADEVAKDAGTAEAYLRKEGIDVDKVKEDAKFIAWLAELAALLHGAAQGQPIKINQEEARKWYDDGATPYQCFRETWDME